MTREIVIERLEHEFDEGIFTHELARRVAISTESQVPERMPHLYRYLTDEIGPELESMGYKVHQILPEAPSFTAGRDRRLP